MVVLVTGLIHLYRWRRLVRDITVPGRWRRMGTVLVTVLAVLVPSTLVFTRIGFSWLAWPGFLWLAVVCYLLVVPQLDRVRIPLAKLSRMMDGARIALVSDIHLGPLVGASTPRRSSPRSTAWTPTSWQSSATWSTAR